MNKKSLAITFVLPSEGTTPGGGLKVVYEYANALVQRGHRVSVVHPAFLGSENTPLRHSKRTVRHFQRAGNYFQRAVRYIRRYFQRSLDKSYRPDTWFKVDPRVRLLWRPSLHAPFVPDADAVVATLWRTAEWVAKFPISKGSKFYLVQHQETWDGPDDRVMATWRLPLHKIVIARWLQAIADEMGEKSTYIPNGLDFQAFGIDVDLDQRNPHRVMMLYHFLEWKGSADGLKALQIARSQVTTLEADLFGVPPAPEGLPSWIRYHRNPAQVRLRELYNQAAVFLAPSWAEGWGLPPSEAMICGAAVAATDIGGHREFCLSGRTAMLSPPKDPNKLAQNLLILLRDQEQRMRVARAGNGYIQQFTWKRATDCLESALTDVADSTSDDHTSCPK